VRLRSEYSTKTAKAILHPQRRKEGAKNAVQQGGRTEINTVWQSFHTVGRAAAMRRAGR